ncbi:MAG: 1,4-alpha-glucan branching protein GlgB [Planctomycetes bacterium]|nr:1,4-alpha-glucan branching protein GlgB [Planctomycetota bacterium]
MAAPTLSEADISRLVRGRHDDPFSVLGAHRVGEKWVVRAHLYDAVRVSVRLIDDASASPVPMRRFHESGIFEAEIGNGASAPRYVLSVTGTHGQERQVEDPYRFGSLVSEKDLRAFASGRGIRMYEQFGAHSVTVDTARGTRFLVWAPAALRVSVIGDFNGWDGRYHPMRKLHDFGCWELFIPGIGPGALYRYEVVRQDGEAVAHSDPVAFRSEVPPMSASIVEELGGYSWGDSKWMEARSLTTAGQPMAIYEVHLGSWRRPADNPKRFHTYRELADLLPGYVKSMGFTHVELLPVAEHPYYGSWGYQVSGYFSATSRYGGPRDFMALVDALHREGIGVILDWVPAHFPTDAWALARFDGTGMYEHIDPRQGFHQDWQTYIFNFGRPEVVSFLAANALFWLDKFHIDGLRVDAVSSMVYLDYSRKAGEWVANKYGGRENLEAIELLRNVNTLVSERFPGAAVIAEESTAFAGVTRPAYVGGLGFHYKWNMGWMHDYLEFFRKDPIYRKHHTGLVTFALSYSWSERFIMVLSHDEVVHLKGSLLYKMPGDEWQKFANLRSLYGMMYGLPGKKLLFMGSELAPWTEWNHESQLEWNVLEYPLHAGVSKWVADLNRTYCEHAPLHALDESWEGFQWIDFTDVDQTTFSWLRFAPLEAAASSESGADAAEGPSEERRDAVVVIANLTPVPRYGYRIGVPRGGVYREILNSDAKEYGGSGLGNYGVVEAQAEPHHGKPFSIAVTMPPLSVLMFRAPSAPPRVRRKPAAAAKPKGAAAEGPAPPSAPAEKGATAKRGTKRRRV